LPEKKEGAEGEYDFLKDARKIMAGDFPAMHRMKRKLAIEIAVLTFAGIVFGWLDYSLAYNTVWISAAVAVFIALFVTLELLAFRAYWYTPADIGLAVSSRKYSRRFNSVTTPMKIVNISFALFFLILIFIDANVIRILSWEIVVLLLSVQVGLSVFSRRWILYARNARRTAAEFSRNDNDN
jgi:uncharacterized protein YggT (Ycf19 family)